MAEFLLELFSEEIPARMQVKAADDLKELFTKALTEKGLAFTSAAAHSTPRRITLVIDGLSERQPDQTIEKRGPRLDAPQQAIDGFLKANNLTSLDSCAKEETPKGSFWFYREEKKGEPTPIVLDHMIDQILRTFIWPKSMKWSWFAFNWVRPLHSVLAVFNGRKLDGKLTQGYNEALPQTSYFQDLSGFFLTFSDKTFGHRFLSNDALEGIKNFADYKKRLYDAHVILERSERKKIIMAGAQKIADSEGLVVKDDDALLEEIVGLVEWPVPLMGQFETEYLSVPQEVLISTMRGNQKYLALLTKDGKLSNKFIVIANMITKDGGKQIVAGNEKVLRARLSDAKFFWDEDCRKTLESRVDSLDQITFHAKLGTVKDKTARLQSLAASIAVVISADGKQAERAARLAKADLVTGVVYQFPEVQGIMGRYYALHDKEPASVANAISDHYKPLGPSDAVPSAPVSIALALADKLDTLTGFFAIDEKPTGSKDPYALRRAALGVIRLVLENKLRVSLKDLFRVAYKNYKVTGLRSADDVAKDLMQFFVDRLKVSLKDKGIRHDLIDAVFAAREDDDLTRVIDRVQALQKFLETENGKNLLAAYKRAANIVRIEEKKDGKKFGGEITKTLLSQAEETMLSTALENARTAIQPALEKEEFARAMAAMAELRGPVDAFFDKVTVNDNQPEIRANRLRLLSHISSTLDQVADFSRIEG